MSEQNYLNEWKPGDDICIVIETKNVNPEKPPVHKTQEEINELFDVLKCAAHNAGFDLSTWGLRPSFESAIKKRYVRAKILETVLARDLQLSQMYPEALKDLTKNPPPVPEVKH